MPSTCTGSPRAGSPRPECTNLFRPKAIHASVETLDGALVASSMVVALMAGTYAGFGLNAPTDLDRRAELWFALAMWAAAMVGALAGGDLAIGFVLGALVLLALWSVLHFPQIGTLETPLPRRVPLFILVICIVTAALLGLSVFLVAID